jgi:hypothetical protein
MIFETGGSNQNLWMHPSSSSNWVTVTDTLPKESCLSLHGSGAQPNKYLMEKVIGEPWFPGLTCVCKYVLL